MLSPARVPCRSLHFQLSFRMCLATSELAVSSPQPEVPSEPVAALRDGARSASIQNMGAAMEPGRKGLKTVSTSHGCSLPVAGMLHFRSIPHSCGLYGTLFLISPNSLFTDENTGIWIICLRTQIAYYFFADRLSFFSCIFLGLEAVCCLVCQLDRNQGHLGECFRQIGLWGLFLTNDFCGWCHLSLRSWVL